VDNLTIRAFSFISKHAVLLKTAQLMPGKPATLLRPTSSSVMFTFKVLKSTSPPHERKYSFSIASNALIFQKVKVFIKIKMSSVYCYHEYLSSAVCDMRAEMDACTDSVNLDLI